MSIQLNTSIGEIVRANFQTARLFEKYRIDFCCGGHMSLEQACTKAGADAGKLLGEVETILSSNDPDAAYIERLELDRLCDYIVERHHAYVADTIPFLQQKLQKLCEVHGDNHVELFDVRELFEKMASNLSNHMHDEEVKLFPLVKQVVQNKKAGNPSKNELAEIQTLISQMEKEHQAEGERFDIIAKFSNNYSIPADGCNTYRVTYQTLAEFEQDLHRHIHLENNVLFKKVFN